MKFGMVGAGTLSRAIAGHVVKAGHDVVFSNSRGPETLKDVVDAFGPHASAGTIAEAGAADFVVLAVPWTKVREVVGNLPAREGRIVIDATNQWASLTPTFVADKLDIGGSELVASLIPGAHVIKAFDNMYGPYVAADPITAAGRRILFLRGRRPELQEALPLRRRGLRVRPRRPRPAADGPPDASGRRTPDRPARHPGGLTASTTPAPERLTFRSGSSIFRQEFAEINHPWAGSEFLARIEVTC
jgi:predicted dinucleotide-binding enzyme